MARWWHGAPQPSSFGVALIAVRRSDPQVLQLLVARGLGAAPVASAWLRLVMESEVEHGSVRDIERVVVPDLWRSHPCVGNTRLAACCGPRSSQLRLGHRLNLIVTVFPSEVGTFTDLWVGWLLRDVWDGVGWLLRDVCDVWDGVSWLLGDA